MFKLNFVINYDEDSDFGYILLVDAYCPEYCSHYKKTYRLSVKRIVTGTTKLVSTSEDKEHYICHIRLLQQIKKLIDTKK